MGYVMTHPYLRHSFQVSQNRCRRCRAPSPSAPLRHLRHLLYRSGAGGAVARESGGL